MVQHRTDGSAPFPHQSFTASIEESIALARLTFPPAIWSIEENVFDTMLDRVPEVNPPEPTETEETETVSYQTSLF